MESELTSAQRSSDEQHRSDESKKVTKSSKWLNSTAPGEMLEESNDVFKSGYVFFIFLDTLQYQSYWHLSLLGKHLIHT
jgi:hypothetical protein